jgi:hypothetical protein
MAYGYDPRGMMDGGGARNWQEYLARRAAVQRQPKPVSTIPSPSLQPGQAMAIPNFISRYNRWKQRRQGMDGGGY